MPLERRCIRCGKALHPAGVGDSHAPAHTLCDACASWQKVHASDLEDRQDATGLGAIRTPPSRHDPISHL